jgi:hypothetical protein
MLALASEWAHKNEHPYRDCPWWYLERTSVGFFSAAIWRSGGQAIEEYATDKVYRKGGKPKKWAGRGDLMFCLKNTNKWYVAEVKQKYLHLLRPYPSLLLEIDKSLKEAREDAVYAPSFGYSRLGIVLIVPWQRAQIPSREHIRQWISNLQRASRELSSAVAWCFPRVARDLCYRERNGVQYYCPGVAIFIKPPRLR